MNSSCITIPEGVGFRPSDKKLLCHYLVKKNQGMDSQITIIPEIDLCQHEPRDLPALVFERAGSRDRELLIRLTMADDPVDRVWHFFSRRDFKSSHSSRCNRTTEQGSWKKQGKDHEIMEIGGKRILTFYEAGEPKANKTKSSWVIHEYYLIEPHSKPPRQIGNFVLYRLKNNSGEFDHDPIWDEAEPSSGSCSMISTVEIQAAANGNHDEAELGIASDLEIQAASNDTHTEAELDLAFNAMIEKIRDDHELENLNSLFPQPLPPHPHQLPQPQDYHTTTLQSPIYQQPGNVSHATNVCNDESRKRNYPFGDNDLSLTKKNNISTNDDDELGRNTSSSSENQAADGIPEGAQPVANLGSVFDSFPAQNYDHALPSINGEPRDFSYYNDFIEWDDLPNLVEDIGFPLA
ncbi:hypothetical protein M0R45_034027 [Rubus argutus]|uniref:NAC domain-containing protein n=1 Tax=Rubus argutus TaxID=59490 RepID=A0AAW1VQ41_RUBAR